jgi:hypothetical protein
VPAYQRRFDSTTFAIRVRHCSLPKGPHPKEIQEPHGHSTIQLTFDRYGHLLPTLDKRLREGLDATWRSAQGPKLKGRPRCSRDPNSWAIPVPRPVPQFTLDALALGKAVSVFGKTLLDGLRGYAQQNNIEIEGLPKDPNAEVPPEQVLNVFHNALAIFFPLLAPTRPETDTRKGVKPESPPLPW